MSELRDAACQYAGWGWAVHPLWPRSKRPATANGKNDATTDLAQVFRWWESCPTYNIGINCEASGLVVIDVDPRNGGDDTLHELVRELGSMWSPPQSLTGGGGVHYFYRHPPGVALRGTIGAGLDIKSAGYVVAPPSLHPSGERYEWEVDPLEALGLHRPPPAWLARMSRQSHVSAPLRASDAPLLQIPSREYVEVLTGRSADRDGWVQCPWHKDGKERTPSMKLEGAMWSCYVCEPLPGKSVCGGNIVSFAGKLWNLPMPLAGVDLSEVMDRLHGTFEPN